MSSLMRYRQDILRDCLANPSIIRQWYAISSEPFERDRELEVQPLWTGCIPDDHRRRASACKAALTYWPSPQDMFRER